MKKIPALILLSCTTLLSLSAADKGLPANFKPESFAFESKKGEWESVRCWKGGNMPSGQYPRVNVMGGATLTISKPVNTELSSLNVGFTPQKTQVYFTDGAQMSVGGISMPGRYSENGEAHFHMSGGALTVGDMPQMGEYNETLNVGGNTTFAGKAYFVMSGGTLTAGLRIGSALPNTNMGTFSVQGSLPVIRTNKLPRGNVFMQPSGTLEFVLDADGVATMDYRKTFWSLHGGTIIADGKAYKGDSKTFILVQTDDIRKNGEVATQVRNFGQEYNAKIAIEKNKITLKIIRTQR